MSSVTAWLIVIYLAFLVFKLLGQYFTIRSLISVLNDATIDA